MSEVLSFANTSYDPATQYHLIQDLLYKGVYEVEFTKLNGELRKMPCTLHRDWLPEKAVAELHSTKLLDHETMSVWCTDKQAWRSFKTMRVISLKELENATK